MTSVSAGRIILTPTQPVGSGRPQRESNPEPPHQESRALPTELPPLPPPPPKKKKNHTSVNLKDSISMQRLLNPDITYELVLKIFLLINQ